MQRLYRILLAVGLIGIPSAIGVGLLACLGLPGLRGFAWAPWVGVAGPLLLVCLPLRFLSEGREPPGPPAKTCRRFWALYAAAGLLFMGAMLYGVVMWPASPLTPSGASYVDKTGKVYSRAEFDAFERWEAVLNYFCLAWAIANLTIPPSGATPRSRRAVARRAAQPAAASQSVTGPMSCKPSASGVPPEAVYRQDGQIHRRRE
jgi:hypothetical protein